MKIFLFIALIFLILLAFVVWDFSRKTEFRRMRTPEEQPQQVDNKH